MVCEGLGDVGAKSVPKGVKKKKSIKRGDSWHSCSGASEPILGSFEADFPPAYQLQHQSRATGSPVWLSITLGARHTEGLDPPADVPHLA